MDWSDDEGEAVLYGDVPFFDRFEHFIRQVYREGADIDISYDYQFCLGPGLTIPITVRKRSPPVDTTHLWQYFKLHIGQEVENRLTTYVRSELMCVEFELALS